MPCHSNGKCRVRDDRDAFTTIWQGSWPHDCTMIVSSDADMPKTMVSDSALTIAMSLWLSIQCSYMSLPRAECHRPKGLLLLHCNLHRICWQCDGGRYSSWPPVLNQKVAIPTWPAINRQTWKCCTLSPLSQLCQLFYSTAV